FFSILNHPPTPQIYTLSLHDALPISLAAVDRDPDVERQRAGDVDRRVGSESDSDQHGEREVVQHLAATHEQGQRGQEHRQRSDEDRKSTRLNSSHVAISYAVFCLKKK